MNRRSRSRSRSRSPSRSDSYRRRRSRSRSSSISRSRSRSPRYRRDSSGRRRDQDRNYRSGQQDDFLEKRKKQREETIPSRAVWARSPPRPVDNDEDSRSDLDSANRRMHRKEDKKDKRKHKDKKHKDKKEKRDKKDKKDKRDKRKSKKRKRSRSRDSNDRDRKRQRKERESSSSESEDSAEQVWTEKKVVPVVVNTTEEEDFGPMPLPQVGAVQKYGGQMLPGEAEAYAQYVQQNKRIPRRGEVGMSNEQIENMETLGYVMSGNRNKRMTAVRIRKENQVLTAEEKRQLVQTTLEEKAKKENKIIADMRELVAQKFKQQQQ